jgi:hypothetical protein
MDQEFKDIDEHFRIRGLYSLLRLFSNFNKQGKLCLFGRK